MDDRDYVKPLGQRISRGESTEKLYVLEERAQNAVRAAAVELGRVLDHDPSDFYYCTLPEALLQVLNSWERKAALLAAEAFVEQEHARKARNT